MSLFLKLLRKRIHIHLHPHVSTTCPSPAHTLFYFEMQLSPYGVVVFICSSRGQIESASPPPTTTHWTLPFKIIAKDLQVMSHNTHLIPTKECLDHLLSVTFRETSVSYEPVKSAYICK